jgi:hypothetical protein
VRGIRSRSAQPCSNSTSSANGSHPAMVSSRCLTRCAGAAPRRWVPAWRARARPDCLTCGR